MLRKTIRAIEIDFDRYGQEDFDLLVRAWLPLTHAINSLSQPDLYPFVLAPAVMGKLRFVHGLVLQSRTTRGWLDVASIGVL
jgi:hypothetical protein